METMTSHFEVEEQQLDKLHMGNGGTQRRPDPSETEIERIIREEIQPKWSHEDRLRRRGGNPNASNPDGEREHGQD
jgi:hypothetical protein